MDVLFRKSKLFRSEVWLAEHKVTEQAYAMKILDSQKPKFNIDRVMRERDILAQSDHKNVVKMVYAFQEKDLFFMALEFHPRGNLNNLVDEFRIVHGQRGDALPEALVRKILSDVLIALEYLHALGIAHRDLKPENLLVAADGRIVLADFGLASVHTPIQSDCNGQERMTHPLGNGTATDLRASAVGSPLYRAPETFSEVLRKSPLPPYSTHLTDFWSLGVMMHELLTGSFALNKMVPPNDIDDMKDLVREMRAYVGGTRPIFWPSDVAVSRQAKSLVEQLLQSNPFARPSIDLVKAHPFFAGVDWNNMDQYRALFIPVGPQATTANTSTSFSLNLPSPLLRGISFAPPMYAHRAAEFQYAGMAQLLMYNHVRVMEHLTATVAESECALVANRSTSSAVTLVEHDDDDEDESEYVPDLQSDADGANALA